MAVAHATFVVERAYPRPPSRVFAFWADPLLKAGWFCEPGGEHELDFRVGGREINRDGTPGGPGYTSVAIYRDIVPDERMIYTYELYAEGALASVSVTTVTLAAEGDGTALTLTEQIVTLDERDTPAARTSGMNLLLTRLGDLLTAAGNG